MKRTATLLAVLGLTAALAACGSSGSSAKENTTAPSGQTAAGRSGVPTDLPADPGSITVGSAGFPENQILAEIYAQAMAAKGVKVEKKLNIGERPAYMAALKDGSIGFIPEYTGSILAFFDKSTTAKTPDDVYQALQQQAAAQGLVALKYAPAQDSDTITVTKATAEKYKLTSIGDLKDVAKDMTFGAPAQFQTRADGIPALKSVYGVEFGTFTPLQAGGTITVTALTNGSVDAADIFSTDPAIVKNGFVSLKDPKSMFAAQNIVPLVAKGKLTQPMVEACNAVSAKLDTETLGKLVAKVVVDGQDAATVAKEWLAGH